jgi:hypothetical protein
MSEHTATVEVLTAEVRVLMVGSRQVTMSVYNQLDGVRCDDIEAFGRVSPPRADEGFIYVVGRSNEPLMSGTLVRSKLPCIWALEHLREKGTIRSSGGYYYGQWRADLKDRASYAVALAATCKWMNLPLIVLAGLR